MRVVTHVTHVTHYLEINRKREREEDVKRFSKMMGHRSQTAADAHNTRHPTPTISAADSAATSYKFSDEDA